MLKEIYNHNHQFIADKKYKLYQASRIPRRNIAVLTCMDARLLELLPAALGFRGGDINIIKNAGGLIRDVHDPLIRSLLIAVLELEVRHIMIIGHTQCGVKRLNPEHIITALEQRGVEHKEIQRFARETPDFQKWFNGFDTEAEPVQQSVSIVRNHPLMPNDVTVSGHVISIETGELYLVT